MKTHAVTTCDQLNGVVNTIKTREHQSVLGEL